MRLAYNIGYLTGRSVLCQTGVDCHFRPALSKWMPEFFKRKFGSPRGVFDRTRSASVLKSNMRLYFKLRSCKVKVAYHYKIISRKRWGLPVQVGPTGQSVQTPPLGCPGYLEVRKVCEQRLDTANEMETTEGYTTFADHSLTAFNRRPEE